MASLIATYLGQILDSESDNEIDSVGTCRHNSKFHRFLKDDLNVESISTDEGDKPERVDNGDGDSRNNFFSSSGASARSMFANYCMCTV